MEEKKLNIYFFNTLCSTRTFELLFKNYNVRSSNAAQNFFKLIADGFAVNPKISVSVYSLLPINSNDQKKLFWKFGQEYENNIRYEYIPLLNIPVLRNIFTNLYVYFKLLFKKFKGNEDNVILIDFLRFSINVSVVLACKFKGIKVLAVVTDLPGYDVLKQSILMKLRNRFIFSLKYDYYVCVTDQLNKAVNPSQKPSIVIESFVNSNLKTIGNHLDNKYEERIIIYAGSLYERYGIKHLIEAFKLIPDKDLRLWIYGIGPFTNSIIEYSKTDYRIHYKGVIPNTELIDVLIRATLLVNPRPTHEEYTRYSFPSKNLEYMSTGTPLLTTKLSGIPTDHFPFVYFIEEDSMEGIYKGITNVLSKKKSEIHSFGLTAKDYVLREKNNIRQVEKIVTLLKSNM